MREFKELEDYQLFYEEISIKKTVSNPSLVPSGGTKATPPTLNEQQISLLAQDLQHPLEKPSAPPKVLE